MKARSTGRKSKKVPMVPQNPLYWKPPSGLDLSSEQGEAWIVQRAKDAAVILMTDPDMGPVVFFYSMIHPQTSMPFETPTIGIMPAAFANDEEREIVSEIIRDFVTKTRAVAVVFVARGYMISQAMLEADGLRPAQHPGRQRTGMVVVAHRRIPGNHSRYFCAPIAESSSGFSVGVFEEESAPGTTTGRFVELMPDLEKN